MRGWATGPGGNGVRGGGFPFPAPGDGEEQNGLCVAAAGGAVPPTLAEAAAPPVPRPSPCFVAMLVTGT